MGRPRNTHTAFAVRIVLAGGLVLIAAACSSDDPSGAGSATSTRPSLSALPAPTSIPSGLPDDAFSEPDTTETEPSPDQRPLPTTATDLAIELTTAEQALRLTGPSNADNNADPNDADPDNGGTGVEGPPDNVAAWGWRQQLLYRVLATNPEWGETVLAEVDASVADAVAANWHARQEAIELVDLSKLSPTLPAWRIIAPPPADELLGYYAEAEATTGVPWTVLAAIHLVETRMGRIEGLSSAGAIGPMQFLPSTWEQCCEGDPTDHRDAILGAADYLVDRGAPDDMERALLAYNNSEHYIEVVQAYASVMEAEPVTYHGYHAWEVLFLSTDGVVHLPEGYDQPEPVEAAIWIQDHPDTLVSPVPDPTP